VPEEVATAPKVSSFQSRVEQIKKKLFEKPSFEESERRSELPEVTTRPTDLVMGTMPSVGLERQSNSGDHIILTNVP